MRFARAWAMETARDLLEEARELWLLIPVWVRRAHHTFREP